MCACTHVCVCVSVRIERVGSFAFFEISDVTHPEARCQLIRGNVTANERK